MRPRYIAESAAAASTGFLAASTSQKDAALFNMAALMRKREKKILTANSADMTRAERAGLPDRLVRRLRFEEDKIAGQIRCLQEIAGLPDPAVRPSKAGGAPTAWRPPKCVCPTTTTDGYSRPRENKNLSMYGVTKKDRR